MVLESHKKKMKVNPSIHIQIPSHQYFRIWWHTFLKNSNMLIGMLSWNYRPTGEKDLWKSSGLILSHVTLEVSCHLPWKRELLEHLQFRVLAQSLDQLIFSHCYGWEVFPMFTWESDPLFLLPIDLSSTPRITKTGLCF